MHSLYGIRFIGVIGPNVVAESGWRIDVKSINVFGTFEFILAKYKVSPLTIFYLLFHTVYTGTHRQNRGRQCSLEASS